MAGTARSILSIRPEDYRHRARPTKGPAVVDRRDLPRRRYRTQARSRRPDDLRARASGRGATVLPVGTRVAIDLPARAARAVRCRRRRNEAAAGPLCSCFCPGVGFLVLFFGLPLALALLVERRPRHARRQQAASRSTTTVDLFTNSVYRDGLLSLDLHLGRADAGQPGRSPCRSPSPCRRAFPASGCSRRSTRYRSSCRRSSPPSSS